MLVLPTGCGKTLVFASLIARRGGSALVLAHRDELLRQAAEKIAIADPTLALGVGFVAAERDDVARAGRRRQRADARARTPAREAAATVRHRRGRRGSSRSARSYRRILAHLEPSPLILGVTATPAARRRQLLGEVWEEIVYQRGIAEMIRAGYLADVRGIRVGLEQVDLDKVAQSGGDYQADALGARHSSRPPPRGTCSPPTRQHANDRTAVVFVPTVALAHHMAGVFRAAGIRAEALDGTTPGEQRQAILERLHAGETRVVANVAVLTRGGRRPVGRLRGHGDADPLTGEVRPSRGPRAAHVPGQGGLPGDRRGRRRRSGSTCKRCRGCSTCARCPRPR